MSVITEAALRVLLKDEDLEAMKEYRVPGDVIVTPSARAYLIDNKIDLVIGDKRVIRNPSLAEEKPPPRKRPLPTGDTREAADIKPSLPPFEKPGRYESLYGGFFEEKPEHMTALHGAILVFKDHKRIKFRGRLDSLESKIMETQLAYRRMGLEKGVADLADVLQYVRGILRAEVLDTPLEPLYVMGMDEAEIRSRSHNPKKFYGIPHFMPSIDDGEAVVLLNSLRSAVREVEIYAYEAFKTETGVPERSDIGMALNRLSSVFYVMMFRAKSKEYEN